jgi:hypothetical protein
VSAGKVRYFGLSNFTAWQLQRAVTTTQLRGWTVPVTLQPQYNLLAREIEWEIVPACLSEGLGLLPWSPLGGGWLTGKYSRDERPTGASRLGENPDYGVEAYSKRSTMQRTWDVVDAVRAVADGRGVPMASVGTGLAAGPAGGVVGDPRRPHDRAADGEPRGRGPRPDRRGDRAARPGQRPGCGRLPVRRRRQSAARPPDRGRPMT